MELNFSEIDTNSHEIFDYNDYNNQPVQSSDKYWENYNENEKSKKKKVSFNDILTNMNLVVNKNGVLQQILPQQNYVEDHHNTNYQQNTNYQTNTNYQQNTNTVKINNIPIDNSVKHSVIYNKYFKDYVDAKPVEPEIRVPKTIEEYNQMLLDDKLNRIKENERISQIKSTKLLFTTNGVTNNNNLRNIRPTNNSLRMMNFR